MSELKEEESPAVRVITLLPPYLHQPHTPEPHHAVLGLPAIVCVLRTHLLVIVAPPSITLMPPYVTYRPVRFNAQGTCRRCFSDVSHVMICLCINATHRRPPP